MYLLDAYVEIKINGEVIINEAKNKKNLNYWKHNWTYD
ncbi:hypothetical protein CLSAP_20360 [Clostridium saccharoperbutylacetonicum]|nr:hypothetical protein CLSAP_20360 [Clostridium saccharoperbutylacetonicum]NSB30563.1 hypothetical protein [Clostridium saccharoperbutylacetonicum]